MHSKTTRTTVLTLSGVATFISASESNHGPKAAGSTSPPSAPSNLPGPYSEKRPPSSKLDGPPGIDSPAVDRFFTTEQQTILRQIDNVRETLRFRPESEEFRKSLRALVQEAIRAKIDHVEELFLPPDAKRFPPLPPRPVLLPAPRPTGCESNSRADFVTNFEDLRCEVTVTNEHDCEHTPEEMALKTCQEETRRLEFDLERERSQRAWDRLDRTEAGEPRAKAAPQAEEGAPPGDAPPAYTEITDANGGVVFRIPNDPETGAPNVKDLAGLFLANIDRLIPFGAGIFAGAFQHAAEKAAAAGSDSAAATPGTGAPPGSPEKLRRSGEAPGDSRYCTPMQAHGRGDERETLAAAEAFPDGQKLRGRERRARAALRRRPMPALVTLVFLGELPGEISGVVVRPSSVLVGAMVTRRGPRAVEGVEHEHVKA